MTGARQIHPAGGARRDGARAFAPDIAAWLSVAATPAFAIMALMTSVLGDPMLCSTGHGSLLTGMAPMYLLMSAFHSAPWLRLILRP